MKAPFLALLALFAATAATVAQAEGGYQDPDTLAARADRYARAEEKARAARLEAKNAEEIRRFQASGGRYPIRPDEAEVISRNIGQDVSGAYWQAKRLRNGTYDRAGKLVLLTGRGFYCFRTGSGFFYVDYACYYDNGALLRSFRQSYSTAR